MYEPNAARAHTAIERFRETFAHLPKVMDYLDTYYFRDGKTNWMVCERQGTFYGQINTNNYVEAWHRTLKVKFFQQRRVKRVDRVIYVLSEKVIPFFQKKTMESELGIGRVPRKEKKEWLANDKAVEHIMSKIRRGDPLNLVNPISTDDTSTFEVASFSLPGKTYAITTERSDGPFPMITECNCPDFKKNRALCKHIALVIIQLPGYEFQKKRKPEAQAQDVLEDAVAEQPEESLAGETTEAAEETTEAVHPNQDLGALLNDMSTLLLNVNWKGRIANRDALVGSLKRTYDALKEELEDLPVKPFQSHRPRQRRH